MKLHKKLIINGTLKLLTGLHIGDSKENVEIGGVDNPIVRRKDNNEPQIPGSSLKGKLRSLLEIALGEGINAKGETSFDAANYKSEWGKILAGFFGAGGETGSPSRLQVRDAYLTRKWAKKLDESEFTDMPFTEVKFENSIDRIKGVAQHPRQTERIPAGAEFDVQFVINIVTPTTKVQDGKRVAISEEEQEELAGFRETTYLNLLKAGINLLEHDYLGGSGSRGCGQVKFDFNNWVYVEETATQEFGKGEFPKGISQFSAASYFSG